MTVNIDPKFYFETTVAVILISIRFDVRKQMLKRRLLGYNIYVEIFEQSK